MARIKIYCNVRRLARTKLIQCTWVEWVTTHLLPRDLLYKTIPIFAAVISIVITLAGALAMLNLPIAQYPEITPPQITVAATYPGASADVVANNVSAPIEQQVNGADAVPYTHLTLPTHLDV